MAPVTASTNSDSSKIDFAGVEAGAKIFVGLRCEARSARAIVEQETQSKAGERRPCRPRHVFEPRDGN